MSGSCEKLSEKTFALGDLASLLGATLKGDPNIRITGVSTLESAGKGHLSFVTHPRYMRLVSRCKASALIVPPSLEGLDYPLLVTGEPYLALARVAGLFAERPAMQPGIHSLSYIGEDVELGEGVSVGPFAQVGKNSRIGRGSSIYGGVYIGCGVEIGEDCLIHPNVTILDGCRVGNRVTIHSGTVIGSDGFGYAPDEKGCHIKIPQTGIVQIDDDVEIGANCAIDRAAFDRTWIQRGVKIDNLVQIAHNVVVGEDSMLIAQVGISGSTRLGKHVILAGQVGVVGHVEIGDGVRVGAQAGVNGSVKAGMDMAGSLPAAPSREWLKIYSNILRLSRFKDELEEIKAKVAKIEETTVGE